MNVKIFYLIIWLVCIYFIYLVATYTNPFKRFESFTTNVANTPGIFPASVDKAILNDYPLIGKNEVSKDTASDIWWHYPSLPVASFKQVTNNLRYRYNPDNGTCSRSEFCGALYHDIDNKTNIVTPLPEAQEGAGARVGYYRSEPNELYFSIPTNENILY